MDRMDRMEGIGLIVFYGGLLFAAAAILHAQDKPKYQPSEVQQLQLQLAQAEAKLAQSQMNAACGDTPGKFNQALLSLQAAAKKVAQDNKWPATLQFSDDTLTFTDPAPPPAANKEPAK